MLRVFQKPSAAQRPGRPDLKHFRTGYTMFQKVKVLERIKSHPRSPAKDAATQHRCRMRHRYSSHKHQTAPALAQMLRRPAQPGMSSKRNSSSASNSLTFKDPLLSAVSLDQQRLIGTSPSTKQMGKHRLRHSTPFRLRSARASPAPAS